MNLKNLDQKLFIENVFKKKKQKKEKNYFWNNRNPEWFTLVKVELCFFFGQKLREYVVKLKMIYWTENTIKLTSRMTQEIQKKKVNLEKKKIVTNNMTRSCNKTSHLNFALINLFRCFWWCLVIRTLKLSANPSNCTLLKMLKMLKMLNCFEACVEFI